MSNFFKEKCISISFRQRHFVKDNSGHRIDIHMNEYKECKPVVIIDGSLGEFCSAFDLDAETLLKDNLYKLTANSKNPYRQLYTHH